MGGHIRHKAALVKLISGWEKLLALKFKGGML
jgi:hypothetical protein